MAKHATPPSLEVSRPILSYIGPDKAALGTAFKEAGFDKKHLKFTTNKFEKVDLVPVHDVLGYLEAIGKEPTPALIDELAAYLDETLPRNLNATFEDTIDEVITSKKTDAQGGVQVSLGGANVSVLTQERAEVIADIEHYFGFKSDYAWQAQSLGELALFRVYDKKDVKPLREIVERQLGERTVTLILGGIEITDTIAENELGQIKLARRSIELPSYMTPDTATNS